MLYNLALTEEILRDPAKIEALTRRALSIDERLLDADHPHVVLNLVLLGSALSNQHRYDEAEAALQRALPMAIRRKAEIPISEPEILWSLGVIRADRHRNDEAVALFERALAHPSVGTDRGEVRFALAQTIWEIGRDRRRALALAAQAKVELRDVHPATVPEVDAWLATHGGR